MLASSYPAKNEAVCARSCIQGLLVLTWLDLGLDQAIGQAIVSNKLPNWELGLLTRAFSQHEDEMSRHIASLGEHFMLAKFTERRIMLEREGEGRGGEKNKSNT